MNFYIRWFWTSLMIGIVLGLLFLVTSCSYGTYNATGSYPNQDNHTTDNCKESK